MWCARITRTKVMAMTSMINIIQSYHLNGNELVAYLQGCGVAPLPTGENQVATDCLRKEKLKAMVRGWQV